MAVLAQRVQEQKRLVRRSLMAAFPYVDRAKQILDFRAVHVITQEYIRLGESITFDRIKLFMTCCQDVLSATHHNPSLNTTTRTELSPCPILIAAR